MNRENAGMQNAGEVRMEERMAGVLIKHRTSLWDITGGNKGDKIDNPYLCASC